jgi:hypothetical protein
VQGTSAPHGKDAFAADALAAHVGDRATGFFQRLEQRDPGGTVNGSPGSSAAAPNASECRRSSGQPAARASSRIRSMNPSGPHV